ncbi:sodium/bile acid cotransporter-like [Silurus meridionalis]|uniref:sodium/bile acid cotransporter-like n=1 Tax=Silurus meridionalis TaxID=175797 RepID=UPI001EEAAAB3|nr:sodium/bile acid cotransporter-like [Silurus meridionalis]KAI5090855.1 sodium/bile acid cotransporter [Silurus meridionalis]
MTHGSKRLSRVRIIEKLSLNMKLAFAFFNRTANVSYDYWSQKNVSYDVSNNSTFTENLNTAANWVSIIILCDTMVALGCTMNVSKIKAHIVKPKGVAIAILAQFGVMPLTAFSLAKLFRLGTSEAMAVLVCGCSPGGVLSNVLAYAFRGDMNLSIVMTTCSTLAALGMMPLLLFIYCHGFSDPTAVPYGNLTLALVLTLLPCALGIYINHRVPQYSKLVTRIGLVVMLVCLIVFAVLVGILLGQEMMTVTEPRLLATGALMPLIGYGLGYALSLFFFRFDGPCRRTVAIETGCQNIPLCYTILKVAFEPEFIGPYFLFPFLYFFFQVPEALIFIVLFRWHTRQKPPDAAPANHHQDL